MEITVLVLTPLPIEFAAVIRCVADKREVIYKDQAAYEKTTFQGKHHNYTIIVREPGMKNVDMALATDRAIQSFKPQIVLLVGIAGGVKDVTIGDVLVASKVYGYEAGKEDANGFKARPGVEHLSRELLARVQVASRNDDWKNRCADGAPNAKVYLGPIAAGDKVVAGIDNGTFKNIKTYFNDTLGLEMEAIGFATAIQPYRELHGLVIRSISDLCEGKAETDKQDWQPVAAERAAAFAFELLYNLDCTSFIIATMDAKTLAKEIYSLLFPMPDSFKEIGNDFAGAANNEVREIWKRVKPLFIEEVEELAMSPDDTDAQAGVRNKLKKELEGQDDLRKELTGMVQKGAEQGVSVVNSKNVVVGSTINVGGNFRIGDG